MMRRLLPAPLLTLALLLMWLVLNHSASAAQVLLGVLFAVAAPALLAPLRPTHVRIRHPLRIARLILVVGRDAIASCLQVFVSLLRSRTKPPQSCFIHVPLDLREPAGLAALAIITAAVPGTVWCELARDGSVLLLHAWDVPDVAAFVAHYKAAYEKPLIEIFES